MLTNNFYNMFGSCMGKTVSSGFRDVSGTIYDAYYAAGNSDWLFAPFRFSSVQTSQKGQGVVFGTGNTAPTVDDYCLSGGVITTLSKVATVNTVSIIDGSLCVKQAITVSNSGTATVTICEMGLVAVAYRSSSYSCYVLLDRTVLNEPLTLAPGEQGVVTYTFTLPIA